MAALIEHMIDFVDPYLPNSLANSLYAVVDRLPTLDEAISNPTQLVPLLLSLFAVYAGFMSMYNTTRWAFRLGMFFVRWGLIATVLLTAWSGWNGIGTDEGVTKGVRQVGNVATRAYGIGKTGVNWWLSSSGVGSTSSSSRTAGRRRSKRRSSKQTRDSSRRRRSASGAKKTWSTPDDDGIWDDPAEVDLAAQDPTSDVLNTIKKTILTFSGTDDANAGTNDDRQANARASRQKANSQSRTGSSSRRRRDQNTNDDDDLSQWATNFAINKARRAWNDWTRGGRN
ncbi:hypothetical protein OIO90_004629 [Microbotryomycetes sp. JL221]|nr:hypothetical protein OIO90_004629 [Microbotryomycetes sp. JL221]